MKTTTKRNICEYGFVFLFLTAVIFAFFFPTFINGKSFVWYNDQQFQYNIFYREWHRIIRESISQRIPAVFSWNDFLGTDFFVTKLMHCVGDFIATPFFVLYSGKFNFDKFFACETLICVVLSGLTMLLFLRSFGIKESKTRVSVSLLYALSGYAAVFCGSYMFMRFYALLPLLFYFCEEYIQKGKLIGFALMTALLFLQNYELMFSTSFFLVLYFIFSQKLHYGKGIPEILKNAFPLICSYLVGIAIVGFALLPLIYYLKSNPRVGEMNPNGLIWNIESLLSFLFGHLIVPFNLRTSHPNYPFYGGDHFGTEFSSYITPYILFAYILLFKESGSDKKKYLLISRAIITCFLLIKPLNMIIHGFSEPTFRWILLMIFFDSVTLAYVWDNIKTGETHTRILSLFLFAYIVIAAVYTVLDKDLTYIPYFGIVLLSFSGIYIMQKDFTVAQILSVAISVVLFGLTVLPSYYQYPQESEALNSEYIAYYRQTDESGLFRMHISPNDVWPFEDLNLNTSLLYDYPSVSTYSSTYETVLNPFLKANGINNWMIDLKDPEALKMIGAKYAVVLNENEIDNNLYTYAYDLENLHVFALNGCNEIGHTYSSFEITEELPADPKWNEVLYVSPEYAGLLESIPASQKAQLRISEYNGQYISGAISTNEKSVLLMTIPFSKGWNVIDETGNALKTFPAQGGFLAVVLEKGDHSLSFYYGTPYLKPGLLLSAAGIVLLAPLYLWQKHSKNKKKEFIL